MVKFICCWILVFSVAACATRPDASVGAEWTASPWTLASGVSAKGGTDILPKDNASHWYHYRLPGKQATEFQFTRLEGRNAMAVNAVSSASMLRRKVRVERADLGLVRFSWKVPELIATADMSHRDFDDSPVRIVLAFEGDRSKFSAKNAMLSELSHALTGEEMPYAVLMYVWSKERSVGTVINSPRTDRIRKLVVESGRENLHRWLDYERDVAADFENIFGEPPGALLGMGIMTDTDNTRTTAQAWYGPLQVLQRSTPKITP